MAVGVQLAFIDRRLLCVEVAVQVKKSYFSKPLKLALGA
jgi:hypothetical protein